MELRKSVELNRWRTPVWRISRRPLRRPDGCVRRHVVAFAGRRSRRSPQGGVVVCARCGGCGRGDGLLLFGASGAELGGLDYLDIVTPEPWSIALDTSNAASALFAVLGLTLLGVASFRSDRVRRSAMSGGSPPWRARSCARSLSPRRGM